MFHLYGLMIGIGIATGWWLIERKAKRVGIESALIEKLAWWVIGFGIVGARLYHVVTDFHLYQNQLIDTVKIWQGGLSIIGAVLGGIFGLWLFKKTHPKNHLDVFKFLDLAVFGIPFGQAVGRLGNYFNQELYGLPTTLPWGISIDPQYRLMPYQRSEKFHPLFAYEAVAMVLFGVTLWWLDRQPKFRHVFGRGQYFWSYVVYYAVVRFGLDFLRIDKVWFGASVLGTNQVVMLVLVVLGVVMLLKTRLKKNIAKKAVVGLVILFMSGLIGGCQPKPVAQSSLSGLAQVADRQRVQTQLATQTLEVEVVNTPASITQGLSGREQIGSDGMLFVLPGPVQPTFWMKEMKFDLDLIWLRQGTVIDITANVPHPSSAQADLPLYSPVAPIDMVLEVPASSAARWQLKVGDSFTLTQ